ncbi:MAG: TraR/DksA family transcriptional regulator [Candidatus Omnitrophica bacterium]|nr:TraR/DksA family transcriptional regulator [Candidatus Omnitrophota bacterium]MDD5237673.1 TraR/DksA family transcriptional regulator [Candidatus Omnitrophota bacterium]
MSRKMKVKKQRRSGKQKAAQASRSGKKFGKKELADFRKLILKRKEEIQDDIKHISEETLKKTQKDSSGDISGYTYHMADVATDNYDREFSLGLASNERGFLYELDDALKKVEEGTFGICEECKSLISKSRLKAVPHARLCVKCQEKKERK